MEAAIKKQMATAGYIERFWENLVKVGKDKMTRAYFSARLELLEKYWSTFFDAHYELMDFERVDATDYMKKDVLSSTEETYINLKARITSCITGRTTEVKSGDASAVMKQIQLPKISLPTFSGDQLEWEGFRDLFKSLVHEVEGLGSTQKLQYLRASLTGEAAAVVANIEVSSEGYAWRGRNWRPDTTTDGFYWRRICAFSFQVRP